MRELKTNVAIWGSMLGSFKLPSDATWEDKWQREVEKRAVKEQKGQSNSMQFWEGSSIP